MKKIKKIKKQYQNIPTLIYALAKNQIIWDFLLERDIDVPHKEVDKCNRKRRMLVRELNGWFK